jgi:hypothetical protein
MVMDGGRNIDMSFSPAHIVWGEQCGMRWNKKGTIGRGDTSKVGYKCIDIDRDLIWLREHNMQYVN